MLNLTGKQSWWNLTTELGATDGTQIRCLHCLLPPAARNWFLLQVSDGGWLERGDDIVFCNVMFHQQMATTFITFIFGGRISTEARYPRYSVIYRVIASGFIVQCRYFTQVDDPILFSPQCCHAWRVVKCPPRPPRPLMFKYTPSTITFTIHCTALTVRAGLLETPFFGLHGTFENPSCGFSNTQQSKYSY